MVQKNFCTTVDIDSGSIGGNERNGITGILKQGMRTPFALAQRFFNTLALGNFLAQGSVDPLQFRRPFANTRF